MKHKIEFSNGRVAHIDRMNPYELNEIAGRYGSSIEKVNGEPVSKAKHGIDTGYVNTMEGFSHPLYIFSVFDSWNGKKRGKNGTQYTGYKRKVTPLEYREPNEYTSNFAPLNWIDNKGRRYFETFSEYYDSDEEGNGYGYARSYFFFPRTTFSPSEAEKLINAKHPSYYGFTLDKHPDLYKYGNMVPESYEWVELKNNYPSFETDKKLWETWTLKQRYHFLRDHFQVEMSKAKDQTELQKFWYQLEDTARLDYDKLPELVKMELKDHKKMGQYRSGGPVKKTTGKIIEFSDGFKYNEVSKAYAKKNWENEEIYGLRPDENSEALIESASDIDDFDTFGIEYKAKAKTQKLAKEGTNTTDKIKVSFYKWGEYEGDEEIDLIDLPTTELGEDDLAGFDIREEDQNKHFYASDIDIDSDDEGTSVKRAYATEKQYAKRGAVIDNPAQTDMFSVMVDETPDVKTETATKYRADVGATGENNWSNNAMEYDTMEEAQNWLRGLAGRWFGYNISRVVPVSTPKNQPIDMNDPTIFQNYRQAKAGTRVRRTNSQIAQDEYNSEVDKYNWYVLNERNNDVVSGFEYKEDANDLMKELNEFRKDFRVVSKRTLKQLGIENPNEKWKSFGAGGSTTDKVSKLGEMIELHRHGSIKDKLKFVKENPQMFFKGGGAVGKPRTNDVVVKELIKDLDNTPYSVGLALLRERWLTHAEIDLKHLKAHPDKWSNPFYSEGMYKDLFERIEKYLSFDKGNGTNDKAVKKLIKDLDNTPYSVGLALLRERALSWAEMDKNAISKNPKKWENPFYSSGMYKDLFERIIKHLSFSKAEHGAKTGETNKQMVLNSNHMIEHHTEELEKALANMEDVPAWVVAKAFRSATDISDITHYIDGESKKAKKGAKVSEDNTRYPRKADDTGKGIMEGWVIGDGEAYYQTEEGALNAVKELGYNTIEEAYENNDIYFTDWYDEDIEDQGYYYTADGKEIEISAKGTKTKGKGYMVFNYTDNIYASNEIFSNKTKANEFIKNFRKRFEAQGYYRDNRMNKVPIDQIDLLAIPSDFSPFRK